MKKVVSSTRDTVGCSLTRRSSCWQHAWYDALIIEEKGRHEVHLHMHVFYERVHGEAAVQIGGGQRRLCLRCTPTRHKIMLLALTVYTVNTLSSDREEPTAPSCAQDEGVWALT